MFEFGTLTRSDRGARFEDLTFTSLDIESTGLDVRRGARICEIAIVKRRGDGTLIDEWSTLIDPGKPIRNSDYHGITTAMVKGAPTFAEIAPTVAAYMDQSIVIGHNLEYEEKFLVAELAENLGVSAKHWGPGLCTLVLARAQLDLRSHRLDSLVHYTAGMGMGMNAHNAIVDARSTLNLLTALATDSPQRLYWDGPATSRRVEGGPIFQKIRPRMDPDKLSKYEATWLTTAVNRLPALADPAPVTDEDGRAYIKIVRTALEAGPLTRERIRPVAAAMSRLSMAQSTANALHSELFDQISADADAGRLPKGSKLLNLPRIAAELGRSDGAASRPAVQVRSGPLKGKRIVVLGKGDGYDQVRRTAEGLAATVLGEKTRRFDTLWAVVSQPELAAEHPVLKRAAAANVPVWTVAEALQLLASEAAAPPSSQTRQVEGPSEHGWWRFWRPRELTAAEYRAQYIDPYRDKHDFRAWKALAGPIGSISTAPNVRPRPTPSREADTKKTSNGCAVTAILVLGGVAGIVTAAVTAAAVLMS